MSNVALLPITADRYTPCVRTIRVVGLDLTGIAMRAQVRLGGDVPGVPCVDLQTVTKTNAEGLRLVSVTTEVGVTTSVVELVINETTMERLPYAGEAGDAMQLAWDWQITLSGRKRRLAKGAFQVLGDGVTGAENAPEERSESYSVYRSLVGGMTGGATLTFGDDVVSISIDGVELLAPLVDKAAGYADQAADHLSNFPNYYVGASGGMVPTLPFVAVQNNDIDPNVTLIQTTGRLSGLLAADPNANLAKYPRSNTRSRNGRIFARVKCIPSISDFGTVGDNSTDDYPAIWEAIEWCTEIGEPELIVPRGQGRLSQTLNLDKAVTLRGNGTGRAGSNISKSILRFDPNVSGIVTHTAITSPRSGQAGITGSEGSRILGLKLIGDPDSRVTRCFDMKARAEFAQNVTEYFGAGVRVAVGAGSGGDTEGNSNNWSVHDCRLDTSRGDGLRVQYGDTNVGSARDLDIVGNAGFAVIGISFLACYYNNIHTASNGTFAGRRGGTFAGVNYILNGSYHFFVPHYAATTQQLGANPPTLDNDQIWIHVFAAAHPAFPVWQSGSSDYMPGGPFAFEGPVKADVMYEESDQGPGQVHGNAEIANGTLVSGVVGRGCYHFVSGGAFGSRRGFVARDPEINGRYATFGTLMENGDWAEFGDPSVFPDGLKYQQRGTDMVMSHGNADAGEIFRVTGPKAAISGAFKPVKPILPGPYTDDADAFAKGKIPIGGAYNKTGGSLVWRQV